MHHSVSMKDKDGNYINGFSPGVTTQAEADAAGQKKEADKVALANKKGKTRVSPDPIPDNPPKHHVSTDTNGPTPLQQSDMTKAGGKFPIPKKP